jgi:plastocyanin
MTILPRPSPLYAAALGALLPVAFAAPAAAATRVIVIDQMKYTPVPPLKVGDTVLFQNRDIFRHTVTASNNSFNLDLPPGTQASLHINSAGHASFYCKYHPGMRGTMVAQ